jgi:hypothetical protein
MLRILKVVEWTSKGKKVELDIVWFEHSLKVDDHKIWCCWWQWDVDQVQLGIKYEPR